MSDTRIKTTPESIKTLFSLIEHRGLRVSDVADSMAVHPRSVRDWRKGKYTISKSHFLCLVQLADINPQELVYEELPCWWGASKAGKAGASVYQTRFGALGNEKSRIAGGVASYAARKNQPGDIYTRKIVYAPPQSPDLAEFMGIMIGDGSIGRYQVSITLDAKTDKEYLEYITTLLTSLFKIKPGVQLRPRRGCVVLIVSSIELANYLVVMGLPRGNKLKAGLDIPSWITSNKSYSTACIRGIFDTDGSIFQETHHYKQKTYSYCRMALVSASPALRKTVAGKLHALGMNGLVRNNRSVTLERFTDIEKYFRIVGSSNPKHLDRWAAFGGVG